MAARRSQQVVTWYEKLEWPCNRTCATELEEDPIEEGEETDDDPVSEADSEKTLDATVLGATVLDEASFRNEVTFVDTLEKSLEEAIDAHEGGENQYRNVRSRLK